MRKESKQLLNDLLEAMEFHRNEDNALPMSRYMKGKFSFLGIKQPDRKKLSAGFIKSARSLPGKEIIAIADALWKQPEREYQYVALELLFAARKKFDGDFLELFDSLIARKPWWDTVDTIAVKLYGAYFAREKKPAQMIAWSKSDQLWQNRTAILFQLMYKQDTDVDLLFNIIRRLQGNPEFFIQKAIGWSLRQYYRTDAARVKEFIATSGIDGLAKREALKHD